ncbi:hypothetical protein VCHA30O60_50122 [Vibrio chagasii]|nr:hypothetical protein [Vibrio crassostreae]CAH6902246.1 hypothetical protein VCHA35P150_20423 [Vibrio chagasii]CAH6904884.1 hypothetical protein VCHA56P515_100032 [Vibrio chagasii]CAH6967240.1 hypothetical protein VCHA30O60_50122 [Vibrio chagasii]CAH6970609.1 hypothetical protein VCHA53O463_110130 [Vibrio chagasii]CAH7049481.1 hypothetical protein VCHA36P166_50183 [Vibrio chagasii]
MSQKKANFEMLIKLLEAGVGETLNEETSQVMIELTYRIADTAVFED